MLDVDFVIEPSAHDPEAAPARSVRRATARRASARRATARSRQDDSTVRIIDSLGEHPGSTAGDLAKALNNRTETVAQLLNQLTKQGDIKKTAHGYNAQAPHQRTERRQLHRWH